MVALDRHAESSELLRLAREAFANDGYAGASVAAIFRSAQVGDIHTRSAFEDKQRLFRAVYTQVDAELADKLAAAALEATDRRQRLAAVCRALLDAAASPEVGRIAFADAGEALADDPPPSAVDALLRGCVHDVVVGSEGLDAATLVELIQTGLVAAARVVALAPPGQITHHAMRNMSELLEVVVRAGHGHRCPPERAR